MNGNLYSSTLERPVLSFLLKSAIAVWLVSYTLIAMSYLADLWLNKDHFLCVNFNYLDCSSFPYWVELSVHSLIGGVLGAGVLGMVSFYKYVSMERSFELSHGWGYLFAPILGGVLGLITFALVQSGLLVFSGSIQDADRNFVSNMAFLAIGFLSGFGWYPATLKIQSLVNKFFLSESNESSEKDK